MRWSRNNERRARFVDKNRVNFVDDCKLAALLQLLFCARLHVVAEIVESKFSGGAVHNIAAVRSLLLLCALHVHRMNRTDGEPERAEEGECPIPISLHEVIVHGDDVDLLHLAAREVTREWTDDRLALAGFHFRNLPLGEHNATDDLHIERARAERRARLWIERAHCVVERGRNINEHPSSHESFATREITFGCAWWLGVCCCLHLREKRLCIEGK